MAPPCQRIPALPSVTKRGQLTPSRRHISGGRIDICNPFSNTQRGIEGIAMKARGRGNEAQKLLKAQAG
jgi:hypothetical protein